MYKYFFKGIFPLIYSKLSKFSQKLFKNYEDYQEAKFEYKNIIRTWKNMYNQLYEEENKKSLNKLLTFMGNKKKEFQNLFNITLENKNVIHLNY